MWEPSQIEAGSSYGTSRKEPRISSPLGFRGGIPSSPNMDNTPSPFNSVDTLGRRGSLPGIVDTMTLFGPPRTKTPTPPPLISNTLRSSSTDTSDFYLPPIDESGNNARLPEWYLSKRSPPSNPQQRQQMISGGGVVVKSERERGESVVGVASASDRESVGGGSVWSGETEDFAAFLQAAERDVDRETLLENLKLAHAKLIEKDRDVALLNQKLEDLKNVLARELATKERETQERKEEYREISDFVSRERKRLMDLGRNYEWETKEQEEEEEEEIEEEYEEEEKIRLSRSKEAKSDWESKGEYPWEAPNVSRSNQEQPDRSSHTKQRKEHKDTMRDSEYSRPNSLDSSGGVDALIAAADLQMSTDGTPSPSPHSSPEGNGKAGSPAGSNNKKDAVPLVLKW